MFLSCKDAIQEHSSDIEDSEISTELSETVFEVQDAVAFRFADQAPRGFDIKKNMPIPGVFANYVVIEIIFDGRRGTIVEKQKDGKYQVEVMRPGGKAITVIDVDARFLQPVSTAYEVKSEESISVSSFAQHAILRDRTTRSFMLDQIDQSTFIQVGKEATGYCRCYEGAFGRQCEHIEPGKLHFGDETIANTGLLGWSLAFIIIGCIIVIAFLCIVGFFWIRNCMKQNRSRARERECVEAFNRTEAAHAQAVTSRADRGTHRNNTNFHKKAQ